MDVPGSRKNPLHKPDISTARKQTLVDVSLRCVDAQAFFFLRLRAYWTTAVVQSGQRQP